MKRGWWLSLLVLGVVWFALAVIFKPPLKEGLSFSQAVYDRDGHLLRLTLATDDKYRVWLPLSQISPTLVAATLLHEDRHFRAHPGVNPASIARAIWRTYVRADRRVGGSTLTMQLARIRYGIHSRTPAGKLLQMLRALQLELAYSKDDILEAYLNLAPYGLNIEGVGAASLIYFDKPPAQLNLAEALALAVIPQSPAHRAPLGGRDHPAWSAARRALFERWIVDHPQDEPRRALVASALPVRLPGALPFLAPHFTDYVLRHGAVAPIRTTTLDLGLQQLLERQVRAYVNSERHLGLRNAAALLIDYRSMDVKAFLGSADFFDDRIAGQVDGVEARRSPGSALKPFIYALGIAQGLIHPMTMLKDAPTSFGGYNPENFDREFVGPIPAHEALIRSRNIPAVQIASRLSKPTLYEFLQQAGVSGLREENYYGLALVLGGAEISMQELVQLYAMLANGGVLRPVRIETNARLPAGKTLLGAEASYLALDMLKDNPPPEQGFQQAWTRNPLAVYWKTGTSHGYRDAWTVGVFGPYVLAVWIGNFDGESNPAFIGRELAAPLFFQLVAGIRAQEPGLSSVDYVDSPRLNLERVEVCALSGQLPSKYCPHRVRTWFIPGTSPIKVCDIHRPVLVDVRTGLRACGEAGGKGVRTEVYEFWPSDLLKIFKQAGIPRRVPPPYAPRCALDAAASRGNPPQITSPQTHVAYRVRVGGGATDRIPLMVVADADVRRVYWFVDEKFLGATAPARPWFWSARPGRYTVRVVDDQGRADAREVDIGVAE